MGGAASIPVVGPMIGTIGTGLGLYNDYHSQKQNRAAQREMNRNMDLASNIAQNQFGVGQPLTESLMSRALAFMQGNLDPTASAMYAPMKSGAEQQYGAARNAIMSNLPRGGTLQDSMAKLEMAKAGTLSGLIAQLVDKEYTNAMNLNTNTMQSAINAISAAMGGGPGMAQLGQANVLGSQQFGANLTDFLADLGALFGTNKKI